MLSNDEKQRLLEIARKSLEEHFAGRSYSPEEFTEGLSENRGAFVTLKMKGKLRGCIGYVKGVKPLGSAVAELAVTAAIHDPRFSPVTASELGDLRIDISAMTPLKLIDDVNGIEVGKHGLYMKKGMRSGLLLPQVAVEWGWDRDEFLEHTCKKAGLAPQAWKDEDTEIYIFSAEVFGEIQQ